MFDTSRRLQGHHILRATVVTLTERRAARPGTMYPIITNEGNNNNNHNNNNNNNNNNNTLNDDDERRGTTLQEFYAGQTVFITGGTGFLGKVLIEKLLRSCPDLTAIYILVRPKKGRDVQSRVEDIFDDVVYTRLKKEVPKFRHKVFAVAGDCSVPDLGLSLADKALLIQKVSIVFHVAATVRFDEKLKLAMAINVQAATDIIKLCRSMPQLKSVIHVSTAYANSHLWTIDEKFYPYETKYSELMKMIENMPEDTITELTPKIIGKWTNTYVFTKALAEDMIREESKDLPMGIFRPAIVISTAREPILGWIDNLYGPTGVVAGAASGVLRTLHSDPDINANIVPVDFTVNSLIASAWDVATQVERRGKDMLIYNYVSSVDAPLTWGEYCKSNMEYGKLYPLSNSIWYLSFTTNKHKFIHLLYVLFLHLLPAMLVDTVSICIGQKPRLWKMYQKIHKFANVISYFATHQWKFTNDNVQDMWSRLESKDQHLFLFNMKGFNWDEYFQYYIKGTRIYLFKDDLSTLKASRARLARFYYMHQATKGLVYLLMLWIVWTLFSRIVY
ncbi:fatty acyl-CoA reductase wat isoform X2 [Neodiprion lecontei]|uniref:Fatty acyl-CoA reductase n=1 Tax=Neodiprion lecontei TaxID=441921 RepID=A0ABM3FXP3_NEOLC|nr:fatty acyl-CoA reductase wat isoform X2 [Neodiprion lecontei]